MRFGSDKDTPVAYARKCMLGHTVSWLNSSVTLLVSKAPLNRTVKNGCF